MSEIIFAIFVFSKLSITVPVSISLNELDLNNSRNKDDKKKNKNFLFFEKLILDVEITQKSQQSGLRLDENKNANIDNSNNVYFRNDGSISE